MIWIARESIGPWFCDWCGFSHQPILHPKKEAVYVYSVNKLEKKVVTKESLSKIYPKFDIPQDQVKFIDGFKVDAKTALALGFPVLEPGDGPIGGRAKDVLPTVALQLRNIYDNLRTLHSNDNIINSQNLNWIVGEVKSMELACKDLIQK